MPKENVNTESKRVILLPKEEIVCAREYPMTEQTSMQLRAARDHFEKMIYEQTGEEVTLPFPTALAYVLNDYVQLKGFKVNDVKSGSR